MPHMFTQAKAQAKGVEKDPPSEEPLAKEPLARELLVREPLVKDLLKEKHGQISLARPNGNVMSCRKTLQQPR